MNIEICNKKYEIKCNAYTRFEYKRIFGVGIFEDIQKLNEFSQKQEAIKKECEADNMEAEDIERRINNELLNELDNFIDVIEKMAYILIYTADKKVGTFEEWLTSIEKVDLSADWIKEVTEFTVNSFC